MATSYLLGVSTRRGQPDGQHPAGGETIQQERTHTSAVSPKSASAIAASRGPASTAKKDNA